MHSDVAVMSKPCIWREAIQIVNEEGFRAFWKGNLVTIAHRLPYTAVNFYAYEQYKSGGRDNNPPDIAKIFFETRHKNGKLVEPETQEKYDEIVKTVQSNASLSHIEVVEKFFGPQFHSHVFGFGGGMKRKNFNSSEAAYIKDLETKLHEKEEENNNLKRRMDGIESRLAKIENEIQPTSEAPTTSGEDHDAHEMPPMI